MTGRERVQRALRFQNPDRAPRVLWALPGVRLFRTAELEAMNRRFPMDFSGVANPAKSVRARGQPGVVGTYVDAWGCLIRVNEPGVVGEVKDPILGDWRALDSWQPPWELLEKPDLSKIEEHCRATDKFVLAGTETRPFERMQFLRGSENLYMDLAYGTAEVMRLRSLVHEFFVREMEMWARTGVDGVSFMDDWGSQKSLLVSPEMWRELFRPLYAEYCAILHRAGKFAFFHSDGNIEAIYPDLIEIGVDAVNSQLFCMDIEELGRRYRGKVTFWGEIDRQHLLPFGTVDEVRAGVRRVRRALDDGRGGVIAQCEWGLKDPAENIAAVFEAWEEPRPA